MDTSHPGLGRAPDCYPGACLSGQVCTEGLLLHLPASSTPPPPARKPPAFMKFSSIRSLADEVKVAQLALQLGLMTRKQWAMITCISFWAGAG